MAIEAGACGLTLVEDHLRLTIADCARFRTWAKVSNQAAALAKIFIDNLPEPPGNREAWSKDEIVGMRPFAIISTARQAGYAKARVATSSYGEAGNLQVAFEENVPKNAGRDVAGLERQFKNTLGTILDEMLELAYTGGYLAIDLITFHGPLRCAKDDIPGEGDHHFAFFDVKHGVGVA